MVSLIEVNLLCSHNRLYLATMHYNENASREQAATSTGEAVYKVVYPKSKKGEGIVKPVKTDPTFSKFFRENLFNQFAV